MVNFYHPVANYASHNCIIVVFQQCCYQQVSAGEFGELLTSDMTDSGSLLSGQPDFFLNTYITDDENIKTTCCVDSDNCALYRQARPVDQCVGYTNPAIGRFMIMIMRMMVVVMVSK